MPILLLLPFAAMLAGCQCFSPLYVEPDEEEQETGPDHHPHSIARPVTPHTAPPPPGPKSIPPRPPTLGDAWTSPQTPDYPQLGHRGRERSYFSANDSGIDTGIERRLDRTQTEGPWEIYPTTTSIFRFGSRMDTGEDSPNVWTNQFRFAFEKPVVNFARYGVTLEYELQSYFFSGENSFVPNTNDPWGLVHNLEVGANVFQPVHEKWVVIVNGLVGWSAASGASLGDGFSWSCTFGTGHRLNDELDIGLGFIFAERFEEDLFFFGGPQFDWRPSKYWRFQLIGAQLDGAYRPNKDWEWGLTGGFFTDRFRLPDEQPQEGRIVTDSRLPIYARLRYRGSRTVDFEARVGIEFFRRVIIEDRFGASGRQFDAEPAPFIGLRWIQRFSPPRAIALPR